MGQPADKAFDRFIFGQAEFVVERSGGAVAVFGALPEFALVDAGEHGLVLLALVLEDGQAFAEEFLRGERDGHLDLLGFPFLPGAAIEPDFAMLEPGSILEAVDGGQDRGQADAVRAVRIG